MAGENKYEAHMPDDDFKIAKELEERMHAVTRARALELADAPHNAQIKLEGHYELIHDITNKLQTVTLYIRFKGANLSRAGTNAKSTLEFLRKKLSEHITKLMNERGEAVDEITQQSLIKRVTEGACDDEVRKAIINLSPDTKLCVEVADIMRDVIAYTQQVSNRQGGVSL